MAHGHGAAWCITAEARSAEFASDPVVRKSEDCLNMRGEDMARVTEGFNKGIDEQLSLSFCTPQVVVLGNCSNSQVRLVQEAICKVPQDRLDFEDEA